jgi:uncharacterized lipoprotein YajG
MLHYRERIMLKLFRRLLLVTVAILMFAGCTTRAWYDGLQNSAAQACQTQPSSERARCEARLNKQDYDSYEKQRTAK